MKNWYRILILFLVSSSLLTFTAAAQQKNTDTERALVLKLAAYLKDSSYIKNTIRQIETEKKVETQITGYQKLHKQVQRMLLLQSELKWLNMEAIRLAYEDMKKTDRRLRCSKVPAYFDRTGTASKSKDSAYI